MQVIPLEFPLSSKVIGSQGQGTAREQLAASLEKDAQRDAADAATAKLKAEFLDVWLDVVCLKGSSIPMAIP